MEDAGHYDLAGLESLDLLMSTGALTVTTTGDVYGTGDAFEPTGQLAAFRELLSRALSDGYTGIRVVADNTPLVRGSDESFDRWLRWEHEADHFQAANPVVGVCFFDREQLADEPLAALATMHPIVSGTPDESLFRAFMDNGVLQLAGELDAFGADRLRRVLTAAPPGGELVIDLSEVTFVDHRATQVLLELAGSIRRPPRSMWKIC
ncbi:MAG TPA: MEDS domain-containing protein, partial [Acidimicrobiales bacterium]|nr:MEDS domain-containing protein [Acidimicrobiales bacterium]